MNLSLLTINLHCFVEDNIPEKQHIIANAIFEKDIDIIFMQEVAQTHKACSKLTEDNYGKVLQDLLQAKGRPYYYYYEPIKDSYPSFDEGVALLSKYPLEKVCCKFISKTQEYYDWKSRKILVYQLQLNNKEITLATTHFGWSDGYEVFEEQFLEGTKDIAPNPFTIVAGDFNITPGSKEYQCMINHNWLDIFKDNFEYINKPTFIGDNSSDMKKVRLDYYISNKPISLRNQEILFDEELVSDHFGVYVEISI